MAYDLSELAKRVGPALRRQGVVRAGIFGSAAPGEGREDSDLDVLVERTLFDLVDLRDEVTRLPGPRRRRCVLSLAARGVSGTSAPREGADL